MAFTIIESSSGRQQPENLICALIDSAADTAEIPEDASPGSIAFTADMSVKLMKGNDGSWQQIGG